MMVHATHSGLALTENRPFSRQLLDGFLSAFSHQPKISRFPWKKLKVYKLRELAMKFYQSLKNFEKEILLEMS